MIVPSYSYTMTSHGIYVAALVACIGAIMYAMIPRQAGVLTVRTTSGTVQGFVDSHSFPDVRQFLGIPFAEPPVDDLRWAPPRPKVGKVGGKDVLINATVMPPSCPQFETTIPSIYTRDVRELVITGKTSEDCLSLNIWAPLRPKSKKLPVFVWIYGGAFKTGGVDVPYQNPSEWLQRTQEHIVVAMNYRVNIFGFPNARALREQNLGILDQRLAIEWVRDNIAKFGGDATKIIIWGQSAGAVSVDILSFAYSKDPIASGLIMESGSAMLDLQSHDIEHTNFTFVANALGCGRKAGSDNDDVVEAEAELKCMRKIPHATIEKFLKDYEDDLKTPQLSFIPSPDEKVVFADYATKNKHGELAKVPAIIGSTANEGVAFLPYGSGDGLRLDQSEIEDLGKNMFLCPIVESSEYRKSSGRIVYRYLYAGNFTNISPKPWMGAYHSSELPLLFGTHSTFRSESTVLEYDTSHAMQDLWLGFAKDPYQLHRQDWSPNEYSARANIEENGADGTENKNNNNNNIIVFGRDEKAKSLMVAEVVRLPCR